MAYDQITSITQHFFLPTLYDNIFDSNPFLQRLRKKSYVKVDGGDTILVPLEYASTTASGWYSGADVLDTTENEINQAAAYSWCHAYANITIKGTDEIKNSGKAAIISLLKSKIKNAEKTLADVLGTGVYSAGSTTDSITGLAGTIVTTGSTVGGISTTANSWWRSTVDSTTTVTSLSAIDTVYEACVHDNDAPTVGLANRTVFGYYQALLQPQQRFVDKSTADAGYTNLLYRGCPIISDSHCTSAALYFVNEDAVKLFVHKDSDMALEPFVTPANQRLKVAKIFWDGAFGATCLNRHGKLTALAA